MSKFQVIREDEYGVLVECDFNYACQLCKYDSQKDCFYRNRNCEDGRYLTEQEEQEYYSTKHK